MHSETRNDNKSLQTLGMKEKEKEVLPESVRAGTVDEESFCSGGTQPLSDSLSLTETN